MTGDKGVPIDVEGSTWKRVIHKRLRAAVEGLMGLLKGRFAYSRLIWQGLENASSVQVSLLLSVVYAIAATGIGRSELGQCTAYFA